MNIEEDGAAGSNKGDRRPYQVRLPGFIRDDDVGLGDLIKRATSAVGVKPCGGCVDRAARLNRLLTFSRGRSR